MAIYTPIPGGWSLDKPLWLSTLFWHDLIVKVIGTSICQKGLFMGGSKMLANVCSPSLWGLHLGHRYFLFVCSSGSLSHGSVIGFYTLFGCILQYLMCHAQVLGGDPEWGPWSPHVSLVAPPFHQLFGPAYVVLVPPPLLHGYPLEVCQHLGNITIWTVVILHESRPSLLEFVQRFLVPVNMRAPNSAGIF